MNQNASRIRQRCRILNVGPDVEVQRLLAEFAQTDELVSIEHAETGAIGFEALCNLPQSGLPHLVIIPFQLPILTARDFIIAMRSQEQLLSVPIFVWGSQISANQIEQLYKVGAACVFPGNFGTTHIDALRQFVHGAAHVDHHATTKRPRTNIASPSRQPGKKGERNVQLGRLFAWIGCVSMSLWMCLFIHLGKSFIDLVPLTVYGALTGAGLLLMWGRTHIRTRALN